MNQSFRRRAGMLALAGGAVLLLSACASPSRPPLATVPQVDLQRFMGDWYVIANIPTFIERGAHNAVESYRLDTDGSIATTFTFRAGAFDGPERRYEPRGFVIDRQSNAVWGMQFVWPIKADYRIAWLADDYGAVVIGREKRDYLWIMARQPVIEPALYDRLVAFAAAQGYDTARIQRVPQRWPQR
jgi:apolipoprotein D and lipocalin family protein